MAKNRIGKHLWCIKDASVQLRGFQKGFLYRGIDQNPAAVGGEAYAASTRQAFEGLVSAGKEYKVENSAALPGEV
jgi:hypothetical protein